MKEYKGAASPASVRKNYFAALVQNIPGAIFVVDAGGRIGFANDPAGKLLNRSPHRLAGEDLFGLVHPEDRGAAKEHFARVEDEPGSLPRAEARFRREGGGWIWTEITVRNLLNTPDVGGVLIEAQDVTGRKRAEERLRDAESRYRALVEQVPGITYIEDIETNATLYDSPQIEEMLGYPRGTCEQNPMYWWEIIHPDDRESILAAEARAAQGGKFSLEYRCIARDGRVVWLRDEAQVVCDPEGNPRFWQGVIFDITDRKHAEEKLRKNEARLRDFLDNASDLIQSVTPDGRFLYVNRAWRESLGYSEEEVRNLSVFDVLHPDCRDKCLRAFGRVLAGEPAKNVEATFVAKDGRQVEVAGSANARFEGGKPVVTRGIFRDVTGRRQMEERLRESEARYRTLVESIPAATYVQEMDHNYTAMYVSPQIETITGYAPEDFYSDPDLWYGVVHPDDREAVIAEDERTDATGEPFRMEHRMVHRDGRTVWVRDEAVLIEDEAGRPRFWQGVLFDITERKQMEERLRTAEERFRSLVENIPAVTYMQTTGEEHSVSVYVSPQMRDLLGYEPDECISDPDHWVRVLHPEDRDRVLAEDARTNETCEPFRTEYRQFHKSGRVVWIRDEATLVRDETGAALYWLGVQMDITERKVLEEELQKSKERLAHQAFHDSLTGLPNRALFLDRLEQALARAERRGNIVAVLFLDLDNFKLINDSLGHHLGDRLLTTVAGRLKSCLRPQDTAARIGGDEFAVLLEDIADAGGAVRVAERIMDELRGSFALGENNVFTSASVGIALSRTTEWSRPDELLRNADNAMYRAKERGKAGYEVFEPRMHERVVERLGLENDLRGALERGEMELLYQPKVLLGTGEVSGVEALLRWEHPGRGTLLPGTFLPLAEETGVILPLGRWVLREACRQARLWQERRPSAAPLEICVNLSARQLACPDLAADVERVLHETGVPVGSLNLEITESAIVGDEETVTRNLRALKDLGALIAIDDFGTGYSSLSYLRRLPVDFIKMERSFIDEFVGNSDATSIVGAIISLAHVLGLKVVGEGVENAEQLERLREMGCDMAQGNYFSEPRGSEAVSRLLEEHPRW